MEAPHLSELVRKYADDGLVVLAVNAWDEDEQLVREFVQEQKLTQRVLLNGREVAYDRYRVPGVPTLLWIDGASVVTDIEIGFAGAESLESKTKRLLSRPR